LTGDSFVIKRHLAITLSIILTAVSFVLPATVLAQSTAGVEKIRARVQVLSAGKDSQVEVKFRDKTKVKGHIVSVEPVSFTLKDSKDRRSQSINYSEVDSVSKASNGVSTKTWLILGGVAAGAVTTWLIVKPAVCDGGAQTRGAC
jgi:small nuclear ribonucleoprotein (snRNP)-like protein